MYLKKAAETTLYKKFARKMLMKLTPGAGVSYEPKLTPKSFKTLSLGFRAHDFVTQ